jgi:hypothetical protein
MNDRLYVRIFGLIYSHPHPSSPNTATIRNAAGLPLPTELTGEPVASALIGAEEQQRRKATMQKVCSACHSRQWVEGHFAGFEAAIRHADAMTLAATEIVREAWKRGLATGPEHDGNPFDEAIEKQWVEQWLFYANSTRFAAAMAGADYGVFAHGRWYLAKNVQEMSDWLRGLERAK